MATKKVVAVYADFIVTISLLLCLVAVFTTCFADDNTVVDEDIRCGAPDVCCEMAQTQSLLALLINQIPAAIQQEFPGGSWAASLDPGTRAYSLASGGFDFAFKLYFSDRVYAKKANVSLEISLANLPGSPTKAPIHQQCRLQCYPGVVSQIVCTVPDILSLLPSLIANVTNNSIMALPSDTQGNCGIGYSDSVLLCYRVNVDAMKVLFLSAELKGNLTSKIQAAMSLSVDIGPMIRSLRPLDEAIIYMPNPVVEYAAKIPSTNLTVIRGLGLNSDVNLDQRFTVSLSVVGIQESISCKTLDREDSLYIEYANVSEIAKAQSGIICLFAQKDYISLSRRARSRPFNATHFKVKVTVKCGKWQDSAHYYELLPPPNESTTIPDRIIVAIVVPIGAVFLICVTLVILLCVLSRGKSKSIISAKITIRRHFPITNICLGDPLKSTSSYRMAPMISADMFPPEVWQTIDSKRLSSSSIILGDDIGTGHFGVVKRGTLLLPHGNRRNEKAVAIKFIQNCTNQKELQEFFEEAIHMFAFDHPNVLGAYGIMYDIHGWPGLVLPLMDIGDLRKFVQNVSAQVTELLIVDFGRQIAEGMQYLADKGLIHRDLAARNCLLNKFRVVKIADFGLSRLATSRDYEYVPTYEIQMLRRPMPIRWMAPECVESGVFSEKTDVWAYGVLLWELASRGQRPYALMDTPLEVIRHVCTANHRLPQLPIVSDCLYAIMVACWTDRPSDRPTFAHLVSVTRRLLDDPNSPLLSSAGPSSANTTQANGSGGSVTRAEMDVYNNFREALQAISIRTPEGSGESHKSSSQHVPIPSRRGSAVLSQEFGHSASTPSMVPT